MATAQDSRLKRQNLESLNARIKSVLNPRLELAPAAEAFRYLARAARRLSKTEVALATVVGGWTFGQGRRWQPLNFVTYRQFAEGIGLITQDNWHDSGVEHAAGSIIRRGLLGLQEKGIVHRIGTGRGQVIFYHLSLVEDLLAAEHRYHEGDPDSDEADAAFQELEEAERTGNSEAMRDGTLHEPLQPLRTGNSDQLAQAFPNGRTGKTATIAQAFPKQSLSRLSRNSSHEEASPMPTSDERPFQNNKDDNGDNQEGFCGRHGRHLVCDSCRQGFKVIGVGVAQ